MGYENAKVLKVIKRSRGESLVISSVKINNVEKLDLRVNYFDEEGNLRPTKRGITIKPEDVNEVIKAIEPFAKEEMVEVDLEGVNIEDIEVTEE